jgi:hypothetical protein
MARMLSGHNVGRKPCWQETMLPGKILRKRVASGGKNHSGLFFNTAVWMNQLMLRRA